MKSFPQIRHSVVIKFAYYIFFSALIFSPLITAQKNEKEKIESIIMLDYVDELPDDEYVLVQKNLQQRSPAFRYSSTEFTSVQVNVDSLGLNILGDAANEPSITVDPANPNYMAIGWRQFDTISSNFRQAGYGYSTDGGQTWMTGVIEPGIFRSDPVLDANNYSKLFYYSLSTSGGYTCELFNSVDGGAFWSGPVPAYGGDKGWMTIDRTGGVGEGNIYCFSRDGVSTSIVMTRSIDGGQFFQPLVNVPGNPGRGTIAVGVDGVIYAAGRSFDNGEFVFARSSNAPDSTSTPVFEFSTQIDLGGQFSAYAGPNPGGLLGQTIVACDNFGISGDSTVYVLSSVDPPGSDPLDVYFIRSTDRGVSWSSPVKINDDSLTGAWQWFGTMSVAPNGRIDVVWLDTRDNPGTYLSSLYYSFSTDNGITWSLNEKLSEAFDPHLGWPQQNKLGDYFDMISYDEYTVLAWAGTFNGEQDVYFGKIYQNVVGIDGEQNVNEVPEEFSLSQNYPNPFNPSTKIKFTIPSEGTSFMKFVELKVYDVLGNEIAVLINEEIPAGTYEVDFSVGQESFPVMTSGVYFYQLKSGSSVLSKKMILIK